MLLVYIRLTKCNVSMRGQYERCDSTVAPFWEDNHKIYLLSTYAKSNIMERNNSECAERLT
jgi:hypothetical protein